MPNCLRPVLAYDVGLKTDSGKRKLSFKPPLVSCPCIPVPCGKCSACLANRRKEWISRLRFEEFSSDASTFVTLTYDDDHIPSDREFDRAQVQRFLKRLRNASRDFHVPPFSLRYFLVGEYGSQTHRPHYHAIFFGVDMLTEFWLPRLVGYDSAHNRPRFCSDVLARIWPYGFNVVGSVTSSSIRYVSKYVSKSIGSNEAPKAKASRPFCLKSLGLGRVPFVDVIRKGRKVSRSPRPLLFDSFSSGFAVLPSEFGFSRVSLPRVLDRYVEEFDPVLFADVKASRLLHAKNLHDERSPLVRERPIINQLKDEFKKGVLDNV